jgi:uncharacterized membrane protein YhaH (DUF805 family)
MSWYLKVLKNYAVFDGRARRAEYWYFALFSTIFSSILVLIDMAIGFGGEGYGLLSGIYGIAVLVPSIAVTVRRLHDTDRTGWWILIVFVPLVGLIGLLVFMIFDSDEGANQYGENPIGAWDS